MNWPNDPFSFSVERDPKDAGVCPKCGGKIVARTTPPEWLQRHGFTRTLFCENTHFWVEE